MLLGSARGLRRRLRSAVGSTPMLSLAGRLLRFERMEPRQMLSVTPAPDLDVGIVYTEDTTVFTDMAGDLFELHWQGGVNGTQLTQFVIDTDKQGDGLSEGDAFWDTTQGGLGAGAPFGFEVVSHDGFTITGFTVADGGSKLIVNAVGWDPGEKLVFRIDVDELQNGKGNSLVEGAEFEGSKFTALFQDTQGHYEDATGNAIFYDDYDTAIAAGLNLPLDGAPDAGEGSGVRTAGAGVTLVQQAKPFTISGRVYDDRNLNNSYEPGVGDSGIGGVSLELLILDNGTYVSTGLTATTAADGTYSFTYDCPGTFRVVETQPVPYFSVGAEAGKTNNVTNGAVTTVDIVSGIVMHGGDSSVQNNFAEALPGSLSGQVWADLNKNDIRDGNEPGLVTQISVQYLPETGPAPPPIIVTTNAQGLWEVDNLRPGNYRITEVTPAGYEDHMSFVGSLSGTSVDPNTIDNVFVGSGAVGVNYDFAELLPVQLSGVVYDDLNLNNVFDTGEQGIGGVTLELFELKDGMWVTTGLTATTNSAGQYTFIYECPGTFRIVETQPVPYFSVGSSPGKVTPGDIRGEVETVDILRNITLIGGEHSTMNNFAEALEVSISGHVFVDANDNGIFDSGETGIANAEVRLIRNDDPTSTIVTHTAADGSYSFTGLRPGTFRVVEIQPSGYLDGQDHIGSKGGTKTEPDTMHTIVLQSGDHGVNYDFGEIVPATISGFVFQDGATILLKEGEDAGDVNIGDIRDGQRTSDDTPIAGVVLRLADAGGEPILDAGGNPITTTTDANGYYEFRNLRPGTYTIFEVQPDSYVDSLDTQGTTGGIVANRTTDLQPYFLSIDHNYDTIALVAVGQGQTSVENNFSEVTFASEPPPPPPPPNPPQPPFFVPLPPEQLSVPLRIGEYFGTPMPQAYFTPYTSPVASPIYFTGGSSAPGGFSWHLSVIDAGHPRGDDVAQTTLVRMTQARYDAFMQDGGRLNETRFVLHSYGEDGFRTQERVLDFGKLGSIAVVGDFNGDGVSEVGIYIDGQWYIDINGNGIWDENDLWAQLGGPNDLPVAGDWDGDGKTDIGIFGPSWHHDPRHVAHEPGIPNADNPPSGAQKNMPPRPDEATAGYRTMRHTSRGSERADLIDHVFYFGIHGDIPLAGDWNGDGVATIGVFQRGTWILDDNGDGRWLPGETVVELGQLGDVPVVGDFNGDGTTDLGVYRNGKWILDTNGNGAIDAHDRVFELGGPDDQPIVGDWDGDGRDDIGVFQGGKQILPKDEPY